MAEKGTRRKLIAYGLIGLAALSVVYRLTLGSSDDLDAVPDDAESREAWACQSCGEVFVLTAREFAEYQIKHGADFSRAGAPEGEPVPNQGVSSFRQLRLACAKCGKSSVKKAATCVSCKTHFAQLINGQPVKCPKCGTDPNQEKKGGRGAGRGAGGD